MESIRIDWPIVYLLCNVLSKRAREIYWMLITNYDTPITQERVNEILGISDQMFTRACQELELYGLAERPRGKKKVRLSTRLPKNSGMQKRFKGVGPIARTYDDTFNFEDFINGKL